MTEPFKCDLCGVECKDNYYDARIPRSYTWAFVCVACFVELKFRVGTGFGQHYVNGKKVEG